MTDPLFRLRYRLIAWYVGVFAAILVLFGTGVFFVVEREIRTELDESLAAAVDEIQHASAVRAEESVGVPGAVDAFDELRIPGRDLYVFDTAGRVVHPAGAPAWVADLAHDALEQGPLLARHRDPALGRSWRASARPFPADSDGQRLVGVAVADNVEVEQRYPRLLFAFWIAGAFALALVALGGSWLARRATLPAEAAFDQMRRFTADAAHQLRTPLSVIRSRGEVALRRERGPEDYRAALRDVTREAGRLGGVVEKLLMLARADAGEVAFRRERVFLDDVVEEALVTLQPLARERDLTLEADALHEVPVEGDATLLEQLVVVLVDNAIQFSPPRGRVRIRVDGAEGKARLQVMDEGPGITAADRKLVFEPFYRADPTRGRAGGAGLGLSIARWIVEAHGGTISLDAGEHEVGTTATVLLPDGAGPLNHRTA